VNDKFLAVSGPDTVTEAAAGLSNYTVIALAVISPNPADTPDKPF